MTLALVFAMAGGAFAASHAAKAKRKTQKSQVVITSTKQISSSVLAALKGNAGPAGPTGPAGAAGKDGAAGEKGASGANGESVALGEVKVGEAQCNKLGGSKFTLAGNQSFACNGKEGASVAMKAANGAECKEGGVAFTVAGKTEAACDGKEGAAGKEGAPGQQGPKGEPWSPNNTLPKGATETGQYILTATALEEKEFLRTVVSFPIQLAEGAQITFIAANATPNAPCKGSVEKPEAEAPAAGERPNLCIFEGETLLHKGGVKFLQEPLTLTKGIGPMVTGAQLLFETLPLKEPATETFPIAVSAEGSWAVTG
jgi:hypothetical protein